VLGLSASTTIAGAAQAYRRYDGEIASGTDNHAINIGACFGPLEIRKMPLTAPPPRENSFGSPLELSRVHWVRPEVVAEVTYLTWTEGGLLRAVSYQGQREDKQAAQVVPPVPHLPRKGKSSS